MESDNDDEDTDESPDGALDQGNEPTTEPAQSESLGATPPDLTDDDSIDDVGDTPTPMETHGNEGAGDSADGASPSGIEGAEPTADDAELDMADDEGDDDESEEGDSAEEPGYNLRGNHDRSYDTVLRPKWMIPLAHKATSIGMVTDTVSSSSEPINV